MSPASAGLVIASMRLAPQAGDLAANVPFRHGPKPLLQGQAQTSCLECQERQRKVVCGTGLTKARPSAFASVHSFFSR